jgi:hypothetical protein
MSLQRALWATPLALAVAVLAHLAVFGSGHTPGAEHATALWVALAAGLGSSLAGAFFAGAFGSKRPIATNAGLGYGPFALAAASAVAFGLIELSEGRLGSVPWLPVAFAILPLALAVAWAGSRAGQAAYRAGASFAGCAGRPVRRGNPASLVLRRAAVPVRAVSFASGNRRGRAPPLPL